MLTTIRMHRALLLEDNELVRSFVTGTLRAHGWEIMDVGPCIWPISKEDCDLDCQYSNDAPDLIVAAVISERDCSGVEAAAKALKRYPEAKILLMSATPPACWPAEIAALMNTLRDDGSWSFLPKPFSVQTLISSVNTLLSPFGHKQQIHGRE